MERITPRSSQMLHGVADSRAIERAAAATLPPHTLMERAGRACASWLQALYPHARHIWLACGPGNNGGDGLATAVELLPWARAAGVRITVSWQPPVAGSALAGDAEWALARARAAGVDFADDPPADTDCAVDALLGLGGRPVTDASSNLSRWLNWLQQTPCPVLCVDLPSGLDGDSGMGSAPLGQGPRHTLSLLTLKPGLFMAHGRDAAGDIWFDNLGVDALSGLPAAQLNGQSDELALQPGRHAAHKGTRGDVTVLGGQDISLSGAGMTGAALLAARAALHGGAGRVFVGLLGACTAPVRVDPMAPELMMRTPTRLSKDGQLTRGATVCGCGGGESVADVLDEAVRLSPRLVLDADALNLLAREPQRVNAVRQRASQGGITVITPHPMEAARLLATTVEDVQRRRIDAAQALADQVGAICILKGSGTVIAGAANLPRINLTGNARLATAGTGDVLAGLVGAALAAANADPWQACAWAVHRHGLVADLWTGDAGTLTAGALAANVGLGAEAR